MYQSSFGFQLRPFSATPRHDWFYGSASAQQVYQSIVSCVERAAGPAMLIGAAGTGKSLICQLLANNLRAMFSVVVLDSARLCTRRAFLQNILFELGLPFRGMEEGELRLSLMDYLQPSAACPNGLLLLVDEAHVLPMRLLEELRMITNLVRNGQPRVRLVLAGNRTLEERFSHPKLESFNQRIAARCYLKPFNRAETADYVGFQLEKAGGRQCRQVIAEDAIQTIYEVTEGLPRLINQVCDHALLLAAADGKRKVSAAIIAAAWGDIQQLPTPWYSSGAVATEGPAVIEFGELDADEPADEDTAAEDENVRNEPAAASAVPGLIPVSLAAQRYADGNDRELLSDNPLETLDNMTTAVEDATALALETSDESSSPPALAAMTFAANQAETKSAAEVVADQDPEFAFDGPSDPFAEEFESEETIADPFPAEQLAAARLTAADALQADVDSMEDLEEDRDELIADSDPLGETPAANVSGDSEENEQLLAPPRPLQKPTAANQQTPVPAEAKAAPHPQVTVSVDKRTGNSLFTIGSGKPSPAAADAAAAQSRETGDRETPPAEGKSLATTSETESRDDRDMIVGIEELDAPIRVAVDTQPDQEKKARAHRAEYQTLFSRMRNG